MVSLSYLHIGATIDFGHLCIADMSVMNNIQRDKPVITCVLSRTTAEPIKSKEFESVTCTPFLPPCNSLASDIHNKQQFMCLISPCARLLLIA